MPSNCTAHCQNSPAEVFSNNKTHLCLVIKMKRYHFAALTSSSFLGGEKRSTRRLMAPEPSLTSLFVKEFLFRVSVSFSHQKHKLSTLAERLYVVNIQVSGALFYFF